MNASERNNSRQQGDCEVESDDKEVHYKRFKMGNYIVKCSDGGFGCPFCVCRNELEYKYTQLLQHAVRVAEGSICEKQRSKHLAMARYLAIDVANDLTNKLQPSSESEDDEEWVPSPTTKRSRSDSRSKAVRRPASRQTRTNGIAQKLAMAEKREKEAVDKVRGLEKKINEMTDKMKALMKKMYSSYNELQTVRRELLKREREALDKVRELEGKTDEMTGKMKALIKKERLRNNELQMVRRELLKREREALDKAREFESKIDEMTDEMNALITKERSSNDELQVVRDELIKGLSDIQRDNHVEIGINKFGELESDAFIDRLQGMYPRDEIVIKGIELCTLWQEKIKDPQWYPFQIIEDDEGKLQRMLKEDDVTLHALKEEWGEEIHDVVVEALTDLQEHNPSGGYAVRELWNFRAKRKAALDEVIRHIFRLVAGKTKPSEKSVNTKGRG